ncbi:geranyl transferase, partial [Stenotrophomonas maltophilia]
QRQAAPPAREADARRRRQPTPHIAIDAATAILAGDALQPRAFGLLADAPRPATVRVACQQTLAHASGASG